MLKLSDAITDVVENQSALLFGFRNGLFNLSRLARFLKPLLEVRMKKEVTEASVLMNLSRMSGDFSRLSGKEQPFFIDTLTVHSGLCSATYIRTEGIIRKIHEFYFTNHHGNDFLNLNQGTAEITLVMDEKFIPVLRKHIPGKPKALKRHLASVGVTFDERFYEVPGLMHFLTQRISLQNINIYEYTSTYNELIFYVDERDLLLSFETLRVLLSRTNRV